MIAKIGFSLYSLTVIEYIKKRGSARIQTKEISQRQSTEQDLERRMKKTTPCTEGLPRSHLSVQYHSVVETAMKLLKTIGHNALFFINQVQ